jgi:small subunit ribosomal protein S9
MAEERYYATGKRKTSIARIWLKPGEGNFFVNKKVMEEYFPRETTRMIIMQPLNLTNNIGKFDINATVKGGGISGQAGAIRHGITKTLTEIDKKNRDILKKAGLLTRDSRIKERKKYGLRGARKSCQYSKR